MTTPWIRSLSLSACALTLSLGAFAQAPTPAAMPHVEHAQPSKKAHAPHGKHRHAEHHHRSNSKYASPQQHEAAAVAGERQRGDGPRSPKSLNEFERNALQRCAIFKSEEDRSACVARVRQPEISGSVEGGGMIREYTQTIQLPAPASHVHPQPTHMPSPGQPMPVRP